MHKLIIGVCSVLLVLSILNFVPSVSAISQAGTTLELSSGEILALMIILGSAYVNSRLLYDNFYCLADPSNCTFVN